MESTKLSARVTAYRDAIKAARSAGITWAQLAALFDADVMYFAVVCRKMDNGKYQPCEQLPLPEPQKATLKSERGTVGNATEKPESKQESESAAPQKRLQRIGESKTKDESEMSAQERLIASIPHI